MEYRKLGQTGLKVSALCLGTMQFGWTADEEASFRVMDAFVEAGGNFVDTADVYSFWVEGNPGGVSEGIIGRWMKARAYRDHIVLATKVRGRMWEGPDGEGLSRAHIMRAVEDSLRRLDVEEIDLYQTHSYDEDTPIDETLRAMDDLVRQGKVRYVGASNLPAWMLMEALWRADRDGTVRYESLQPHYNLAYREEFERELLPVCEKFDIGVVPYSPLAGGFLTGKYARDRAPKSARLGGIKTRYFNERGWRILDTVRALAKELETVPAAVALAWQLANPVITAPIVGANTPEQLRESLLAMEITLTVEQMECLDQASDWVEQGDEA